MDLFPFLIRRCGANIDKRIHNLHTSIRDTELRNDFMLAMQAYVPEADIRVEFPVADKFLGDYGDALPPFAAVWGDFVEMITDRTAQGLDAQDVPSSIQKYAELFLLADVFQCSRFLKKLIDDRNLLAMDRKERAEKLKQRLRKVCQYVSSVSHLIQRAKRSSRFPTVGSRTLLLARESVYSTFAIVLTMLCRVDSTNLHCHQRLWKTRQALSFHPQ